MFRTIHRPLSPQAEAAARNLATLGRNAESDSIDKQAYHQAARKMLKQLAVALGLQQGEYDIRTNYGGSAVAGESTLHCDFLYVQVCTALGREPSVLFRACKSRKDCVGFSNQWTGVEDLAEPTRLINILRRTPSMFIALDARAIQRLEELHLVLPGGAVVDSEVRGQLALDVAA